MKKEFYLKFLKKVDQDWNNKYDESIIAGMKYFENDDYGRDLEINPLSLCQNNNWAVYGDQKDLGKENTFEKYNKEVES